MLSSEYMLEFLRELDPQLHTEPFGFRREKIISRIHLPLFIKFELVCSTADHLYTEEDIEALHEAVCIGLRDFSYVILSDNGAPLWSSSFSPSYWTFENDRWIEIPRYEAVRRFMQRQGQEIDRQ